MSEDTRGARSALGRVDVRTQRDFVWEVAMQKVALVAHATRADEPEPAHDVVTRVSQCRSGTLSVVLACPLAARHRSLKIKRNAQLLHANGGGISCAKEEEIHLSDYRNHCVKVQCKLIMSKPFCNFTPNTKYSDVQVSNQVLFFE